MKVYKKLLLENKAWAQEISHYNPDFFKNLAKAQSPDFLWIGCSDSRVPANSITNAAPGDMFVHRNIANMVVTDDKNLLSVLQFAVNHLKVRHVIICGHYRCGGVQTVFDNLGKPPLQLGVLGGWLENIQHVYDKHHEEIQAQPEEKRLDTFIEFNVREQVINLSETAVIKAAAAEKISPILHGWVYGLSDGIIKEIVNIDPNEHNEW